MIENHVCEFHENIHIINILTKLFSNEKAKIDFRTLFSATVDSFPESLIALKPELELSETLN